MGVKFQWTVIFIYISENCRVIYMYDTVSLNMCVLPPLRYFLFAEILKIFIGLLGVTKSACELRHVLLFVRLSASTRINRAHTGRISMEFVTGGLT